MKKIKKDIKLLVFFLTTLVLAGILSYFFVFYNAFITVDARPTDAKIIINNTTFNPGKIKLIPGNYLVNVVKDGFVPLEKQITLRRGDSIFITINLKKIPEVQKSADLQISNLQSDIEKQNFYYQSSNVIYKAQLTSDEKNPVQITAITGEIGGLKQTIFSPNFQLAILKKQSNETGIFDFKRYDLLHQEYTSMGDDIGDVVWQTDGEKIYYYLSTPGGERSIIKASKNNSEIERIADLREYDLQNPHLIMSPFGDYLLIIEKNIYLFNLYTKKIEKLNDKGALTNAVFSPGGEEILLENYSKDPVEPYQSTLSVMDIATGSIKDLNVRTNLNKSAWFSNNKHIIADTKEGLVKINIENLEKQSFVYQGPVIKAENLILSKDEKVVYFLSEGLQPRGASGPEGNFYSLNLQTKEY